MARPVIVLFLLSVSLGAAAAGSFIEAQCGATEYPALCVESLSGYASTVGQSPQELAQAALAVSVARARSARDFVAASGRAQGLRRREAAAVRDCMDEVGDSVERLGKAAEEMRRVGGGSRGSEEFVWHVSNVETWVSAALTDENTCMDGFSGKALEGQLKASIRSRVVNVAQVTSNALALVTRFAEH